MIDHHGPAHSFARPSSRDAVFATQRASISDVQRATGGRVNDVAGTLSLRSERCQIRPDFQKQGSKDRSCARPRSPKLSNLSSQCELFCEAPGHIAENGDRSIRLSASVAQYCNREFDGDALTALGQGRNRQQISRAIAALAGRHCMAISSPMPRPEILGNDEIERLSHRVIRREAEDSLGAGIPESDDTVTVGRDNGIRRRCQQGIRKSSRCCSHTFLFR